MAEGEFELISKYFKRRISDDELLLGIGDDAAVIQPPQNIRLAISTDTLVESVHFPKGSPAELIARRALRVNLSDMAAMAADPKWFTLNLTVPESHSEWLSDFSKGLHEDAAKYGCALIGGDTSQGSLNIGIQIMGWVENESKYLTRSGAQAGDLLLVTGTLGDAAAALGYLNSEEDNPNVRYLLQRYWLPEPRVEFALKASKRINAACDISDGLVADAGHICRQSGLGAEIQIDQLPLSESLKALSGKDSMAQENALTGGDDYELCMAVSPENLNDLRALADEVDTPISVVGRFVQGQSVICLDDQSNVVDFSKSGYQHF